MTQDAAATGHRNTGASGPGLHRRAAMGRATFADRPAARAARVAQQG